MNEIDREKQLNENELKEGNGTMTEAKKVRCTDEKTADQAENHPSLSETAVRNEKRRDDQAEQQENFEGPKSVLNFCSEIGRRFDVDHLNERTKSIDRSSRQVDVRTTSERRKKKIAMPNDRR